MSIAELKVRNRGMAIFSGFYAIVGLIFLVLFVVYSLKPPHLGVLGVLNLIAAYSVFRMGRWSAWIVGVLFVLGITFGAITLYNSIIIQSFNEALLFHIALIIYLILTVAASFYVVTKKNSSL